MKGGVNSFGGEHGNEHAKPMKVESGKDVRILKGSLKGVKVSLGTSDPMEKAN